MSTLEPLLYGHLQWAVNSISWSENLATLGLVINGRFRFVGFLMANNLLHNIALGLVYTYL